MIIRKLDDINKIPASIERVHITKFLSYPLVDLLLRKCPNLKQVIITKTARRNASKKAINFLKAKGIDIIKDYNGPGRPVTFSRLTLAKMKQLRQKGLSYKEIAKVLNLNVKTVYRALTGKIKFCRWKEDYVGNKSEVVWMETHDADPVARKIADRHYSRKTRGATHFCGPGEKLVLITPDEKALFVWRKNKFRKDGQEGVECTIFRNEGAGLSSDLIRKAMELAWKKWPGQRLFTYVNPYAVKSTDPGFCFKRAGWKEVGRSKGGLILLEIKPRRV